MKIKCLPVAVSVFLALNGTCWAATPAAQGSIRFEGGIVERGCSPGVGADSTLHLKTCPATGRTPAVNVSNIDPLSAPADIRVKLLADRDQGRYYDQQYQLVDGTGAPVRSGNYLITVSLP
jgi:type 1 fimbria pilin